MVASAAVPPRLATSDMCRVTMVADKVLRAYKHKIWNIFFSFDLTCMLKYAIIYILMRAQSDEYLMILCDNFPYGSFIYTV